MFRINLFKYNFLFNLLTTEGEISSPMSGKLTSFTRVDPRLAASVHGEVASWIDPFYWTYELFLGQCSTTGKTTVVLDTILSVELRIKYPLL